MSGQVDRQGARRMVAQQLEDSRREYLAEQRWFLDEAQAREARIGELVAAAAAAARERDAVVARTEATIGAALRELVGDHYVPLREAAKRCEISTREAARIRRDTAPVNPPGPVPETPLLSVAMDSLSAQEVRENLDYAAVMGASREDALTLGVPGGTLEANTRRSHLAHRILREWTQCSDTGYGAAPWPNEPQVLEPFGVQKLAAAEGDVRAVVEDPDFEGDVLRDMGREHYCEFVRDEDGRHHVLVEPTVDDLLEASREAGRIRGVLAARGVLRATTDAISTVFQPTIGTPDPLSRAVREARYGHHTASGRQGPTHTPF